ncbi:hypothetical protein V6N13_012096 [Hibiscus sabdariffa]|uniref:Uncharacterized protein n=1 Tax=Hibiscus sabdariffa TaxID=183260 RepID=A0ABR2SE29_9ROSI
MLSQTYHLSTRMYIYTPTLRAQSQTDLLASSITITFSYTMASNPIRTNYSPYFPLPPPRYIPTPPKAPPAPPATKPPPSPSVRPPPPPAIKPPPSPTVRPPPPPAIKPPPAPATRPPPSPIVTPPPPPHPISPPSPPHVLPPPPGHQSTVIVVVFVSLGGLFFLAFLSAALFCFLKKKKKKEVQKAEKISIDEYVKVQEAIVPGPHGEQNTVLFIEEDMHIEEEFKKNKKISEGIPHSHLKYSQENSDSQASGGYGGSIAS